jgi:ribonuclease HII
VPEHLEALGRLGPTVHHRRFFAPVAAAREKHEGVAIESMLAAVQISETVEVSVAAS